MVYQEDIVLTLVTRMINRPIKWVEDRREHFVATTQERDQYWEAEIAVDSKNNYWLALDGGAVQMYDGENFHQHKIKDGVSSDESFTLYIDCTGNIS